MPRADRAPGTSARATPFWRVCALFLGTFALLQWGWGAARETWIERVVVHTATVKPAAFFVNLITPQAAATAAGPSIKAQGGGLNILNGCEGTEIMFLLLAAFAAAPMRWRDRFLGLAIGIAGVFVLNQARILALFYAFRSHRPLFDALHTLVLPAALVAAVAFYFYVFLHRHRAALA
jgi:exosortase/archaeosortase family protein